MLVDVAWIRSVKKRMAQINACDIEDIIWCDTEKGTDCKPLKKEVMDNWQYMGLNNSDAPEMLNIK